MAHDDETGYSRVTLGSTGPEVGLSDDHPGFSDPEYRARRNAIAALSIDHQPGGPIPTVDYSPLENRVWHTVCSALADAWTWGAPQEFRHAVERLSLPTDRVPQLQEVTARLDPLVGFVYEPVAGLAPLRAFYASFDVGRFFSTQYLRHHSAPLYTPEPDIVHEVLGHANQLACEGMADVYRAMGAAVERTESDAGLSFLSRVFWYTVEFGVVSEDGEPKAFGAGILSSSGELDSFRSAEIRPLDFAAMGTGDYDITHFQPVLFAARSYAEMLDELGSFLAGFDDDVALRLAGINAA